MENGAKLYKKQSFKNAKLNLKIYGIGQEKQQMTQITNINFNRKEIFTNDSIKLRCISSIYLI
jgi:hypothetical protein